MSADPLAAPPPRSEVTAEVVLDIVRRHAPSYWSDRPIAAELRLDDSGIGFDSVDLLELLLACERELGVSLPHDLLLDEAMTMGDLVLKLRGAASAS